MDIRDYEQGPVTKQVRVCMISMNESSKCDFVLLELLTLVASRNTTQALIGCLTHPVGGSMQHRCDVTWARGVMREWREEEEPVVMRCCR